jgi:hypothetical protein
MRCQALAAIAAITLASLPAAAQVDPATGARPGRMPGEGQSWPLSPNSSNIAGGNAASNIAPTLPTPSIDANATPQQLLLYAKNSLAAGQTGVAQEAMERAQTRLLDRSTPLFQTDRPSVHPGVAAISAALRALGAGDRAGAIRAIDAAIPLAQ